ncbi:glycosyltransferase [Niveispirillum sp.]|uniref:glycosyltransferase n=1 Tax=Niveispirillum sp. TaxID=1917217 RepID=UPI001B4AC0E7|nr:glycosyltransferase [Niveispirillum sp.]MBP7335246.1 glycosyltransferase [Niveispirillum sp.]
MRIVGHIESYTDGTLIGWAWSPDHPDQRLVLLVEYGGQPVAAGLANLDRRDVAAAGHGDGLCGFRIRVHLPPGSALTVREMSTGTVAFTDVTGPAPLPDTEDAPARSDIVQGNVDNVLGATIRGWCWQPGRPDRHVVVEAVIDGKVVTTAIADRLRGDLVNACIGKGDHAFELRMPFWCLDGRERHVMVHAQGHGPLHETPVPFMCLGGGPISLLEQVMAVSGAAHNPEADTAAALLRCYLNQMQHYLPGSIGFGYYADWRDALTGSPADDIPPAFAGTRAGLAASVLSLRTQGGAEMMAVLDEGAILYPGALTRAALALEASGDDILYGDADMPVDGGTLPWFRPDWNYDLCLSQDYTRGLTLFRAEVLRRVGPCPSATALRMRALLGGGTEPRIHHLPEVLCHLTRAPGPELAAQAAQAVGDHLAARGVTAARIVTIDTDEGLRRVEWPVPAPPPLFSLIIPTRDRLHLVRAAVESIESRTAGADYEIIIIDNQSCEPETIAWLAQGREQGRFRVISYDAPFNFADMNNRAVEQARGSIIGFINNDVELIGSGWLRVAAGLLARPEVGAVGARLRFSNGMIQHGGVIVGTGGLAENAFQTVHVDDRGYFHRTRVAGNYSAVTAACLFCRRADFLRLGGFDAENLPIAFNDVDFCLRLRETGALIVWTPEIDLYHHESLSRGRDSTPERLVRAMKEENYMRRRWKDLSMADPHYNPNLNLDGMPFTGLALPPRHLWRIGR